ncbi:MAG: PDZ domain-containing protein [Spirochaetales bacterium]|nr:PDZ domain-containing protein [Spirochaetales bacterium]
MRKSINKTFTRVNLNRFVQIISVSLIILGCTTTGASREILPLSEVTRTQIEENITGGNPFTAIQDLDLLSRDGSGLTLQELAKMREDANQAILILFKESLEKEEYLKALAIARSPESVLLGSEYSDWTQTAILTKEALRLLDLGEHVAAFLTFSQALDLGQPDQEDIDVFVESASKLDYTPLLEQIESWKIENGVIPGPAIEYSLSPSIILEGTATILVNKGFKLERGVGYPDQVIGSGFFVDPRGYLITNYHVINSEVDPEYEGFSRLFIRLHGSENERIPARLIGWDSILDIALLKAEVEPGYFFPIDPSVSYEPGERIYAIGSPGGLLSTVTSGIVSATGRRFLQIGDALQVDVPINPGNSGGPLLNEEGRLIGVVFAGIEQFEGVNFAIPSRWITHIVPRLFLGGSVQHSWMGMAVEQTREGLEISYVVPGEPAARAGLAQGDLLLSMNGLPAESVESAQALLIELSPDTLIKMEWEREGVINSGILALGERPNRPLDMAIDRDIFTNLISPLFGMSLEETGSYLWDRAYTIRRIYPGGIADEMGLSVNDPLTIRNWEVDEENRGVYLQIVVKKRKAGFIERGIQLGAYLEIDNFI